MPHRNRLHEHIAARSFFPWVHLRLRGAITRLAVPLSAQVPDDRVWESGADRIRQFVLDLFFYRGLSWRRLSTEVQGHGDPRSVVYWACTLEGVAARRRYVACRHYSEYSTYTSRGFHSMMPEHIAATDACAPLAVTTAAAFQPTSTSFCASPPHSTEREPSACARAYCGWGGYGAHLAPGHGISQHNILGIAVDKWQIQRGDEGQSTGRGWEEEEEAYGKPPQANTLRADPVSSTHALYFVSACPACPTTCPLSSRPPSRDAAASLHATPSFHAQRSCIYAAAAEDAELFPIPPAPGPPSHLSRCTFPSRTTFPCACANSDDAERFLPLRLRVWRWREARRGRAWSMGVGAKGVRVGGPEAGAARRRSAMPLRLERAERAEWGRERGCEQDRRELNCGDRDRARGAPMAKCAHRWGECKCDYVLELADGLEGGDWGSAIGGSGARELWCRARMIHFRSKWRPEDPIEEYYKPMRSRAAPSSVASSIAAPVNGTQPPGTQPPLPCIQMPQRAPFQLYSQSLVNCPPPLNPLGNPNQVGNPSSLGPPSPSSIQAVYDRPPLSRPLLLAIRLLHPLYPAPWQLNPSQRLVQALITFATPMNAAAWSREFWKILRRLGTRSTSSAGACVDPGWRIVGYEGDDIESTSVAGGPTTRLRRGTPAYAVHASPRLEDPSASLLPVSAAKYSELFGSAQGVCIPAPGARRLGDNWTNKRTGRDVWRRVEHSLISSPSPFVQVVHRLRSPTVAPRRV
ncbi:hypothetical protein B0H13DRAFT_1855833 [Mycena leptocephala]|nr:hypothetical protein B0H13DRAFT_1855833 [Mycena leptocephala]